MQGIADWLRSIGLTEYAQRFAENAIDVSDVHRLTEQDLQNSQDPGTASLANSGRHCAIERGWPDRASHDH